LLLFLERSGYAEETYHTFSYSRLRDDDGAVVSMLCVVSEETERVIGERRMATLRDLGSDPSVVRTEQQMLEFAGRQLSRNQRDLPFTLTYLFQEEGQVASLAHVTGIATGHPAAPQSLAADADGPGEVWPAAAAARGERGMWEKVLLNLLSNALKFTFDGAIRVTVSAERDQALVTVADTGIGVPADEMPRLFERFHRIENARSRSNEGSGIGLALVRELVELHGGTISAESSEGEGTCFTIRVPFGTNHLPATGSG
jgi:anti-sigma regulatory factor (Ser/Thr protein kinase)